MNTIDDVDYANLEWHICPVNEGQIVIVEYAVDGDKLYCRTTDQSNGEQTLDSGDISESEDPFEPQNNIIPGADMETCYVGPYTIILRDECGSSKEVDFGDDMPDNDDCESEAEDWCRDGDWGNDGASVRVYWSVVDSLGQETDIVGSTEVEIEPNHSNLIAEACGRCDRSCGDDPDDHDWTSEGEGGCTENPGVWSLGGTKMVFHSHCRTCGLHRKEYSVGPQHNPGEHDTTEYEMPEEWCQECENEECNCKVTLED